MFESDGTWQMMSVTERKKIAKVYSTTCTRHLSNTFLDGGSKAEQNWLGGKLEDSLASAEAQALRVSSDITALVRAVSKDVGEGIKVHAKGSPPSSARGSRSTTRARCSSTPSALTSDTPTQNGDVQKSDDNSVQAQWRHFSLSRWAIPRAVVMYPTIFTSAACRRAGESGAGVG